MRDVLYSLIRSTQPEGADFENPKDEVTQIIANAVEAFHEAPQGGPKIVAFLKAHIPYFQAKEDSFSAKSLRLAIEKLEMTIQMFN